MKKCVVAGCSGRGLFMFARPMARGDINGCELKACFDVSKIRADKFAENCGGKRRIGKRSQRKSE